MKIAGMATLTHLVNEFCDVLKNRFIDINISKIFTELQASEKVPFTYDLLESENFFPKLDYSSFKSAAKATQYRNLGNDAFVRKKDVEALKYYIRSVASAPPSSPELALAYANRSAVLFRLGKYNSCLLDVNRALKNDYPDSLKPKLLERRKNCSQELRKSYKSNVLDSISDLQICENRSVSVNDELNQCDSEASEADFDHKFCLPEANLDNVIIPNASSKMKIHFTPEMGRHFIATENIEPGDILAIEKPYASILLPNFNFTHCSYCFVRSESLIPCTKCSSIMFCSERCRENAAELFHNTECPILATALSLKIGEMEWLAFRTLIVAAKQGKQLMTLMKHPLYGHPISKRTRGLLEKYISEDYVTVHNLEDNFTKRCAADIFQRSVAVAILLHLLKKTSFFSHIDDEEVQDDEDVQSTPTELTDSESFCGTLLLKYLFNALSNAHEISELVEEKLSPDSKFTSQNLGIGAGLYPLHSLTNHSCDPNVVRHNHKNAIVSRAIQPIKAGDQLFDNYGYHYATHPREDRRSHLRLQYFFECACDPCEFDWLLHEKLPIKSLEITSDVVSTDQLEKYSAVFKETVESLGDAHGDEQLDFMCKYLSILHKNTRRPSKEYNECQECIKQILALRANHYRVPYDCIFLKL